ncbi:MAG TPA: DUF1015 domain-containing protein [Candidatus Enterenecus stercoripullorum]|nr:DUF1015 domain-containing protein [Candidatus Enterenecus stercoripullorum]
MSDDFSALPFRPADILLPQNCDLTLWSVVACDQYTSQPEYWQRVEEQVGRAPSTLRLILPESSLDGPHVETDIMDVNNTMSRYLREGRFSQLEHAMIYVERTLHNGKVRRGLMGMVDLEQYDYEAGSCAPVRATEGVVLSRIPPRVAVRKNAPIELPHAMLLCDDPRRTVIEPLAVQKDQMDPLYDFPLMEDGGRVAGWRLGPSQLDQVAGALSRLADPSAFHTRYHTPPDTPVMLFAVGDGNHSLATAKECYERQKRLTDPQRWDSLPARFALCELVNLHDDSLEFAPIHRVVFHTDPQALLTALIHHYPGASRGRAAQGQALHYVCADGEGDITIPAPPFHLPVGTLQLFLDEYLAGHAGRVDYIHGEDVARQFAARPGNIAFLLPAMDKESLFPSVIHDGALPRKTFSMGQANDKRFYLEARKIR